MARKLQVYRTPIGFHDAYVAAPSQKAALEAWGSDANLFARGAAELVEDPKLSAEPLANPGTIIKRARGTTAEHLRALPKDPDRDRNKAKAHGSTTSKPRKKGQPKPRRDRLEAAEQAVAEMDDRHRQAEAEQDAQERKMADARRRMEASHEKERAKLVKAAREARSNYEEALRDWEPDG